MNSSGPRIGDLTARGTHLLAFGDGSVRWRRAARRLGWQARSSGLFQNVVVWDASDLSAADPLFFAKRAKLFDGHGPGFGYWSWKPFMLRWYLERPDLAADRILYLDSGVHLNMTPGARRRFREYETLTDERSILVMQCDGLPEREWTKPSVLERLNMRQADANSGQIMATLLMLNRSSLALEICREWEGLSLEAQGEHLLDPANSEDAGQDLLAHRHDQSVFSCLVKSKEILPLRDEAYFAPDWRRNGRDFPLWAVRNRSGTLFVEPDWLFKIKKGIERLALRGLRVMSLDLESLGRRG